MFGERGGEACGLLDGDLRSPRGYFRPKMKGKLGTDLPTDAVTSRRAHWWPWWSGDMTGAGVGERLPLRWS